jgi:hypothetical protein
MIKRRVAENRDAGVSESIGFMLIFTIIIAGIGLVTLYGYPMLLQQQTNADEQIMEKNMIVLQNDLKSLAYKMVPYKETSLKVGGGSLTVYNMSDTTNSAQFQIYDDSGIIGTAGSQIQFSPGDLRYDSTSSQSGISLENGAVVKRMLAQEGSTMLAEPRWFYDSETNTAVIYLIGFNSTDIISRTGIGTVKMNLDQTKTNSTSYDIPSGDVIHIKYIPNTNADYSTAWDNYFVTLGMSEGSGNYYFPANTVKKLVINRYEIIIKSL